MTDTGRVHTPYQTQKNALHLTDRQLAMLDMSSMNGECTSFFSDFDHAKDTAGGGSQSCCRIAACGCMVSCVIWSEGCSI